MITLLSISSQKKEQEAKRLQFRKEKNNDQIHTVLVNNQTNNQKKGTGQASAVVFLFDMTNVWKLTDPYKNSVCAGKDREIKKRRNSFHLCPMKS